MIGYLSIELALIKDKLSSTDVSSSNNGCRQVIEVL